MKKILTVMLAGLCTASVIAAPRVETIAPQPDDSGMLGAFVRRTYAVDKFNAIRAYEGIRVVYTPGAKHASVSAQVDPQVADSFKLAVEDGALVVRFAGNVVDCHPGDVPRAIVYVEGPAVSQVDLRNWSAVEVTAPLKVSELQVGVGKRSPLRRTWTATTLNCSPATWLRSVWTACSKRKKLAWWPATGPASSLTSLRRGEPMATWATTPN